MTACNGRLVRAAVLVCAIAASIASARVAGSAASRVVTVQLPLQGTAFRDAPGVEVARANCLSCHSAEYVTTQPALSKAGWTAEVNKMKGVYGAPIAPSDVDTLVTYLVAQNPAKR
jgi:cytochrome c5